MLLTSLISVLILTPFISAIKDSKSSIGYGEPVAKISYNDILYKSDFPYAAILMLRGEPVCGSAIIGRNVVLTVAHCVYGGVPSEFRLKAGTYWKFSTAHGMIQYRNVENIIVHEEYNITIPYSYDIAIVQLERDLVYTSFVKEIQIATAAERESSYNKNILFLGWGVNENGLDIEVLQKAEMELLDRKKCIKKAKGVARFDNSMVCGISKKKYKAVSGASGDSGGPMIRRLLKPEKRDILLGAVSFGIPSPIYNDRCLPSYPLIFADFAALAPWINEKIGIPNVLEEVEEKASAWYCCG